MMTIRKFKIKAAACFLACLLAGSACSDYLDIVPDNIPTLDNAFAMRSEAEKYLFTCYSYMIKEGFIAEDPAYLSSDEIWCITERPSKRYENWANDIAQGLQNSSDPLFNHWTRLYQGIRVCNIFLENINSVPDLKEGEMKRWIAEVKTLKAYYYFWLVKMYGPIPLFKESMPISATPEQIKVPRSPVDECFAYMVQLFDEAIPDLPYSITNTVDELGRITLPVAATLKAKVLIFAASPLFNGNTQFQTLKNHDGTQLFNPNYEESKWEMAVKACREAITICENSQAKIGIYKYSGADDIPVPIKQEIVIRNSFTERWNKEIIWANTQSILKWTYGTNQTISLPNLWSDPGEINLVAGFQPPLKIAEMFYTKNGVPIEEDKEWQNLDPLALRTATGAEGEKYYIKNSYTTIQLHFDREPRFYASLGFDGGLWYGQGITGSNPEAYLWINGRMGSYQGYSPTNDGPITGYYWKKCVPIESMRSSVNQFSPYLYAWPSLRLTDLYLLYAEAINEAEGPNGTNSEELFKYIDLVRSKSGLEGVKDSYDNYATVKKYATKEGMRDIIQRERLIELAFEGQRYWDIRRWMTAAKEYAKGIYGWRLSESSPEGYYQPVLLFDQTFGIRDYFWPIQTWLIDVNSNLVQNIGW
jgi:hypothetical protein